MSLNVSLCRQRGSMLVVALAVMVVLGLLVVALTRLLGNAGDSLTYEVLSVRAQSAAQAVMEQRLYVVLRQGLCASGEPDAASGSQALNEPGLFGCQASWQCQRLSLQETDGSPFAYYRLESQGECGASPFKVRRLARSEVRP